MASIEVDADFAASLDGGVKAIGVKQDHLLKLNMRRYISQIGSLVGASGVNVGTMIPGPEGGKVWHVHRLTIGLTIGAANPGTAGTIVVGKSTGLQLKSQGSGQIIGNATGFVEVERTTTVPSQLTWGRSQFVLTYPQNLTVIWMSGTANYQLVFDVDAQEYYGETLLPQG